MGKDIKGRELGKGLTQRKDGRYSAKFPNRLGKREEKCFSTLPEARNWLEDARYEDRHRLFNPSSGMTVDDWFDFWKDNIVNDLAYNTLRNYQERYRRNIQPVIGKMRLEDVRPMHCKMVLNAMDADYQGGTIEQAYITMGTLFKSALMNDLINKHPMDGVRYNKPLREPKAIRALTVDEQSKFLEAARNSHNYRQYALLLETGLRTGEMIGLTWDSINWETGELTVSKQLEYRHSRGTWHALPPKTKASYRTIPLTQRALSILKEVYEEKEGRKKSPELEQTLPYVDRLTGQIKMLDMRELVFINYRTGMPNKNSSYDTHLYKLCDVAGIEHFCMHVLRHTYATRAVEREVPYKVLQKLLGHASLKTTMDRYVHTTGESLKEGVRRFEAAS